MRFSTARRAATDDVARSLLFTIVLLEACVLGRAMNRLLEMEKAPDGKGRPRPHRLTQTAAVYRASGLRATKTTKSSSPVGGRSS